MFLLNTTPAVPAPSDENAPAPLPDSIREHLSALGVPAEGVLHIQADLDSRGHWSERHLIATPQRVLVFSLSSPDNGIHGVPTVNGSARLISRWKKTPATNGEGSTPVASI